MWIFNFSRLYLLTESSKCPNTRRVVTHVINIELYSNNIQEKKYIGIR
jgi:hypothetical protein